jgi:glycosyltransferase involved in cell wall biosynthesis
MINVLVAIAYKPDLLPFFYRRMLDLSDALIDTNLDFQIDIARHTKEVDTSGPYASPQARARNALLDEFLRPEHDYVLWIDADIVEYPPDLLTRLYNANPGGIAAPAPLVEDTELFYDTYGFIENGDYVSAHPPYFKSTDRFVHLDCVGCTYLIPASLYHTGVRYSATPERTEHESVMRQARHENISIVCDRELIIYHANLPKYGLAWHGH